MSHTVFCLASSGDRSGWYGLASVDMSFIVDSMARDFIVHLSSVSRLDGNIFFFGCFREWIPDILNRVQNHMCVNVLSLVSFGDRSSWYGMASMDMFFVGDSITRDFVVHLTSVNRLDGNNRWVLPLILENLQKKPGCTKCQRKECRKFKTKILI